MTVQKARVTQVPLGSESLEGLMLPDGSFAISASQVAAYFQFDSNQSSRTLKSLLGAGFQFDKVASEIHPKKVNVIDLLTLEKLIIELAFRGNEKAQWLGRTLVGLSLTQLFSDAFGVKFNTEERERYVKFREAHKKSYHPNLTKWLQIDGCEGIEYGKQCNIFKACCGLPLKSINTYTEEEMDLMNKKEVEYNVMRKLGLTHPEALERL